MRHVLVLRAVREYAPEHPTNLPLQRHERLAQRTARHRLSTRPVAHYQRGWTSAVWSTKGGWLSDRPPSLWTEAVGKTAVVSGVTGTLAAWLRGSSVLIVSRCS